MPLLTRPAGQKKSVYSPDERASVTADEITSALTAQEIAEQARIDSERLNDAIAARLREGATIASQEFEFDWKKKSIRRRKAN